MEPAWDGDRLREDVLREPRSKVLPKGPKRPPKGPERLQSASKRPAKASPRPHGRWSREPPMGRYGQLSPSGTNFDRLRPISTSKNYPEDASKKNGGMGGPTPTKLSGGRRGALAPQKVHVKKGSENRGCPIFIFSNPASDHNPPKKFEISKFYFGHFL